MSILVNRNTRVITQGITGKTARIHTRLCRDYANGKACFVAGVHPGKGGQDFEGIPIYTTVREAKEKTGATVSVIYVPPQFAAGAIDEAVDAGIDLVICITTGIPACDMARTLERMEGKPTRLLGPNCPGLIVPDEIKIGIIPSEMTKKGRIGVVSRPEVLTYEAVRQLSALGLGQSTGVGIGDDALSGLKLVDVMRMFNDDPDTDAVVMVGDMSGDSEETCARWIRDHMTKPVIGYIVGAAAPAGSQPAAEKLALLQDCGVVLTRDPSEIGGLLKSVLYEDEFWMMG